jgi:hypothetical protein
LIFRPSDAFVHRPYWSTSECVPLSAEGPEPIATTFSDEPEDFQAPGGFEMSQLGVEALAIGAYARIAIGRYGSDLHFAQIICNG